MYKFLFLIWLHFCLVRCIMYVNTNKEVSMTEGYYKVAELIWKRFGHLETIPDYLPFGPTTRCNVTYRGVDAEPGRVLIGPQIEKKPITAWQSEPNELYCIYMMGVRCMSSTPFNLTPEAEGKGHVILEEFPHWIVGNIPGNNVSEGNTLLEYQKAESPPEDVVLVYAVYVFEQLNRIKFAPVYYKSENKTRYEKIEEFAKKHKLGEPICGNFFVLFY